MMPSSSSSAATSSASNSHEPPTMRQPFVLTQEAIRNAGLHILTPHQLNCAVIVYDLSDDVSIKQLNEFFTFCGGVEKIILNQNQREQLFAVVVLEDEAAFSTAVLLNQAILNDQTISVVSYREFIGHGSSSSSQHTNRNSSNSSKQSYLEHLQEKQSAYDKAISLIAMGYVKSQQALDEMREKSKELDEQTKDLRQQIAESTQPIVSTTKMTWESTTQKLQPMLGAAREKTAQVTAPVLHTTKEKVGEMKERINNSQVWENETVKQGIAATNAAKEGLYTAGQGAWTAIKTSWFSFASDVKTESTQLKGEETLENAQQGSSSTDAPPSAATSGEQEEEEQPVDNYFQFTPASSENNNDLLDVSENVSNENNEPSTSYTLGVDEDGDEYGVVATSPATPN